MICPSCETSGAVIEERHVDPVQMLIYGIWRCPACSLQFAEPRHEFAQAWHEESFPERGAEERPSPESEWRFQRFFHYHPQPGRVLDYGCGDGGFMRMVRARGGSPSGVEADPRMASVAKLGYYPVAFSLELLLISTPVDAVVLFDVLEHLPEPGDTLLALKPFLKRGGTLTITLPNADRPGIFPREAWDYPPHHFTRWTTTALAVFLDRHGYAIKTMDTYGPTVWWFSELVFDHAVLPLLREFKFLVSGQAGPQFASTRMLKTGDIGHRIPLARLVRIAARVLTYPVGAVLAAAYSFRRDAGEHIYCEATKSF